MSPARVVSLVISVAGNTPSESIMGVDSTAVLQDLGVLKRLLRHFHDHLGRVGAQLLPQVIEVALRLGLPAELLSDSRASKRLWW